MKPWKASMIMTEIRQPQPGQTVVFVDEHGKRHDALLTAVHGEAMMVNDRLRDGEKVEYQPCVNLLFVTGDEAKRDPYGLQIERESSVVHRCDQSAHGMYWEFHVPGEV